MPIFQYRCMDCGKEWDFLKIKSDEMEPEVCKYCGSSNIQKLFPKSNFTLKGDLWPSKAGLNGEYY